MSEEKMVNYPYYGSVKMTVGLDNEVTRLGNYDRVLDYFRQGIEKMLPAMSEYRNAHRRRPEPEVWQPMFDDHERATMLLAEAQVDYLELIAKYRGEPS